MERRRLAPRRMAEDRPDTAKLDQGHWLRDLRLLFYASLSLWSVLAFSVLRTDGGFGVNVEYLFKIVLPIAAIGYVARWGALRLQERRAALPEAV